MFVELFTASGSRMRTNAESACALISFAVLAILAQCAGSRRVGVGAPLGVVIASAVSWREQW